MSSQKASTLQSKFLSSLSNDERAHVFELSKKLEVQVRGWVERYPQLVRPVRVPQGCLTLAAAAPFLGADKLMPAALMIFWVFITDDLVDEGIKKGSVSANELWGRFDRALALLKNPRQVDTGGDPLLEALKEIRDELARFPRFELLRGHLVEGLRRFLLRMRREAEWNAAYRHSPRHSMPTFRRYLKNERQTSGSRLIYLCVLTTMEEVSIRSAKDLQPLFAMEYQAACSIRLANDLRGYEREVGEGKQLNALNLLKLELETKEGLAEAAALEKARELLTAAISDGLKNCVELKGKDAATDAERFIVNLASFACDFYAHHDYHHNIVRAQG